MLSDRGRQELRGRVEALVRERFGGSYRSAFERYAQNRAGRIDKEGRVTFLDDAGPGTRWDGLVWAMAIIAEIDRDRDRGICWVEFAASLGSDPETGRARGAAVPAKGPPDPLITLERSLTVVQDKKPSTDEEPQQFRPVSPAGRLHGGAMSDSTQLSPPKVEWIGNLTILTFTANATRDVEDVLARELEVLPAGTAQQHLLLNFTHVKFLNSTELGTLISFHQRAKRAGGRLTLFALSPLVFELFTVARLDTFLEICRDGFAARPRTPAAVGTSDAMLTRR